jgi:hypothetical protein
MRNKTLCLLISFFLLSTSEYSFGQIKQLKGYIKDTHSDEPIPFATVKFLGTKSAKLSDSSGHFTFTLNQWFSDSLLITYAGFEDNYIKLDTTKQVIEVEIQMERKKVSGEVVVKSKIGRGLLLWRKIIKYKDLNDRSRFDNYSYELYNKLEIDLNNVNVQKLQKGFLPPKPFKFILNNVDTISEATPILPIYLIENISDYYAQSNPKKQERLSKQAKQLD